MTLVTRSMVPVFFCVCLLYTSGAFLCAVVFKQPESVFSEQADGDKIAERHESHSDVGKAPGQVEGGNSTEHDHAAHQYTVDVEHPFTVGKVDVYKRQGRTP